MTGPAAGARIWLCAGATDMRRGFTGLGAMVADKLGQNPFDGHLFVFRGRRGDLIKVLWWDGDGLCLFAKRLERGRFVWPRAEDGAVLLAASRIHGDDTPVPVLDPGRGKTKTGRSWTYVRDKRPTVGTAEPAAWFAYSPDRKGERQRAHLAGFGGTLHADAYPGFNGVYEKGKVREAACWAHVRRKFFDIEQAHASQLAAEALARIGALYGIEKEIRGSPSKARRRERQARAKPLLEALRAWLYEALSGLSKKSETAKAIRYALGRWPALTRYVDDGERAATMYSLIGTAKLNGIDPEAYLRFVLECIADYPI